MTEVRIPAKLKPVFSGPAMVRGAYGGRGSGKTKTFAKMSAVWGYKFASAGRKGAILCGREFQNSLEDSSLEEVKWAIQSEPWLDAFYEVGQTYIRSRCGRITYVFAGLRHNLDSIKSKFNILLAWIDEAEAVREAAWRKLGPTVREEGAEIWVTWNPEIEGSATDKRFRKNAPRQSKIVQINWSDNWWFTERLKFERDEDLRLRPDDYEHIWEGGYATRSDAQVFKGKYTVDTFEVDDTYDGPYYGADWGDTNPTTAVELWIKDGKLYVRKEAGRSNLRLDDIGPHFRSKMQGIEKYTVRADCAQPGYIKHVEGHAQGLPKIKAARKWPGCVEDRVAFLKNFEQIVVHPTCENTARELRLYSYKVDPRTDDVLPDLVKKHDHWIDAMGYALEPMIKRSTKKDKFAIMGEQQPDWTTLT